MHFNRGLFITGTDTDVGKTWLTTRIIKQLRSQHQTNITPMKPIESGWNTEDSHTDAWRLAHAADQLEQLDFICPWRFKAALSPPRAAALEQQNLSTKQVASACFDNIKTLQSDSRYNNNHLTIVEGAGGFYSPLTADGLNADLAEALNFPILLVVADKLGCINHTLLTLQAIEQRGLKCLAVALNHIPKESDDKDGIDENSDHLMDNHADLQTLTHTPVISMRSEHAFDQLSHIILQAND